MTATQLIGYAAFDNPIRAFDPALGAGFLEIVGDLALPCAAAAAWRLRAHARRRGAAHTLLPASLTFLAVDKLGRVHDHVPHWQVVYLPLMLGASVALVALSRELPEPAPGLVIAALVLLSASFAIHLFGEQAVDALGISRTGPLYRLKVDVKHGAEAGGWLVVAIGLSVRTRDRRRWLS